MKISFLIFVSLTTIASIAQIKTAQGFVYDNSTKQAIPYVNLSILESQIGTSSDVDGSYILEIEEEDFKKNVHLSSLGYKDSIISIEQFIKLDKIYLITKTEPLNEVVISKKFEQKLFAVNPIEREDLCAGFGVFEKPRELALFFPFKEDYKLTEYLHSVKIHFGNFKNEKSKFRLRLFSIGKDGLPNEDLINDNVIVETKKKQETVEVDISDYNLIFPKEGFYIGLEWLHIPFNAQEVTVHYDRNDKSKRRKEKHIKYSPTFSATCELMNEYKVAIYMDGNWSFSTTKAFQSDDQLVPAISLTLSN